MIKDNNYNSWPLIKFEQAYSSISLDITVKDFYGLFGENYLIDLQNRF